MDEIYKALTTLEANISNQKYKGYDPYDLLSSELDFYKLPQDVLFILTQIHKRLPINLRRFLKINKDYSPKALGVLLNAYCKLYKFYGDEEYFSKARYLYKILLKTSSKGYGGKCWGLNFAYAPRGRFIEAKTPSIVVTATIHEGLHEYYKVTRDKSVLKVIQSCCDFVLNDLYRTPYKDTFCFSYYPEIRDMCFNANAMGAEMLARTYRLTGDENMLKLAKQSLRFTLKHQKEDGKWNYRKWEDGSEKEQIDFHQGNIVHSLKNYIEYTNCDDPNIINAYSKGLEYYYNYQFLNDGRSYYRLPKLYPIDIHNQAQGIRVFAETTKSFGNYFQFSKVIANWTIQNMQTPKGEFIYRKGRFMNNNQVFLRWGQAWMFLALTTLMINSD